MCFPLVGLAAEKGRNVYVSPKLLYGLAYMKDVRFQGNENGGSGWSSYESRLGSRYDSTVGGSVALGYDFFGKHRVPVRAEVEYALFSRAKVQQRFDCGGCYSDTAQSQQVQTLFINASWDFRNGTRITPYVGAGLGAAFVRTKGDYGTTESGPWLTSATGSKTVTNLAWNLGFGFGYQVSDRVSIDAGYRFAGLGKVGTRWKEWDDVDGGWHMKTKNLYQHQLGVGMRFGF